MKKCKSYIKLMRIPSWIKNLLIIFPLFFAPSWVSKESVENVILGFICFSFLASAIYIINDIKDVESDRAHENKRFRPLAAGDVTMAEAYVLFGMLLFAVIVLTVRMKGTGGGYLAVYFLLNLAYSMRLKNVPLVDIFVLMSGFLLRLLYGAWITDLYVSFWLCMTVMMAAFYMGFGKRRNELKNTSDKPEQVRGVLKYYNCDFLDKNMYMCMAAAIVFYALWTGSEEAIAKTGGDYQMWTVPIITAIAMKYSLDIESGRYADPIEVILGDKMIILLGLLYVFCMFLIFYVL